MQCVVCGGTGKISCGACWNGQSKALCPDCNGRGTLAGHEGQGHACSRCQGQGRITPPSCPVCGNSFVCAVCGGAGTK